MPGPYATVLTTLGLTRLNSRSKPDRGLGYNAVPILTLSLLVTLMLYLSRGGGRGLITLMLYLIRRGAS